MCLAKQKMMPSPTNEQPRKATKRLPFGAAAAMRIDTMVATRNSKRGISVVEGIDLTRTS
jgi:hypothetical protein